MTEQTPDAPGFAAELEGLAAQTRKLAATGRRVFGHADFGKPLDRDAEVYEKAARIVRAAEAVLRDEVWFPEEKQHLVPQGTLDALAAAITEAQR